MRRYLELGARVTVNTDNTMMSGVTLTGEFASCAQLLGWDFGTLCTVSLNAFDAAFLPHAERLALRATAARDMAQLATEVPPMFLAEEHGS